MRRNINENYGKDNGGSLRGFASKVVAYLIGGGLVLGVYALGYANGHHFGYKACEEQATATLIDMERDGAVTFYDTTDGIENRKFTGMYDSVNKYLDDEYQKELEFNSETNVLEP